MLAVDFGAVRYSPTEGTHYFYDPSFPSIQFLLSGRWEAWDVGWVKYKARDPEIRRIAEEAEALWARDARSGYVPWPAQPPPGAPVDHIVALPPIGAGHQYSRSTTDGASVASTPSLAHVAQLPTPISPQEDSPSHSAHSRHGSSSYEQQSAPTVSAVATESVPASATTAGAAAAAAVATEPTPVTATQTTPAAVTGQQSSTSIRSPSVSVRSQQYDHAQQSQHVRPTAPTVNLSRSRETKILLSLDGDGIRGLSALLVVESLVNAICVKIGQQVDPHQIFDLMGGSSLGGVIAVMLGRLRMQAHRAREAYKQIAKQVFLNKRDFAASRDPKAQTPNADGLALEKEIKRVVKQELGNEDEQLFEGKEDQGDVFIISTHIETGSNKPALMRTYKTRRITGPELDANITIWEAMKATSAAPRYTPPQSGTTRRPHLAPGLADHGTAKNNPIRDLLYECRKLFRYTNDMMILVSIGTGAGVNRARSPADLATAVEDRNAEARAWGDKFEADHAALMHRGWMQYFRFNVPLEDVPLDEAAHEDEVKEKTLAYLARPEVGQRFYACVDAITALLLGPPGR